jgi:hypothetical protein
LAIKSTGANGDHAKVAGGQAAGLQVSLEA